jgi:hypothetical protein
MSKISGILNRPQCPSKFNKYFNLVVGKGKGKGKGEGKCKGKGKGQCKGKGKCKGKN